jgi:hypothetical protein
MDDHDLIAKALASLKEQKLYDTVLTMLSAAQARKDLDFALETFAWVGRGLEVIGR